MFSSQECVPGGQEEGTHPADAVGVHQLSGSVLRELMPDADVLERLSTFFARTDFPWAQNLMRLFLQLCLVIVSLAICLVRAALIFE
jgi:hypothetical protein